MPNPLRAPAREDDETLQSVAAYLRKLSRCYKPRRRHRFEAVAFAVEQHNVVVESYALRAVPSKPPERARE